MTVVVLHEYIESHNSLGCGWPSGLDVNSLFTQDAFQPIPDLIGSLW